MISGLVHLQIPVLDVQRCLCSHSPSSADILYDCRRRSLHLQPDSFWHLLPILAACDRMCYLQMQLRQRETDSGCSDVLDEPSELEQLVVWSFHEGRTNLCTLSIWFPTMLWYAMIATVHSMFLLITWMFGQQRTHSAIV